MLSAKEIGGRANRYDSLNAKNDVYVLCEKQDNALYFVLIIDDVLMGPYITSPIIPCDNCLRIRSAVITGKYLPHIFVGVLLREIGTVDRGRVAAAFRVHEELGVGDVPRQ